MLEVFVPTTVNGNTVKSVEWREAVGWAESFSIQTPLAIFAQKRFICLNRDVQCYFRPCECSLKPPASIPQRCRFLRLPSHLPVLDGCIGGDRASQVALGNSAEQLNWVLHFCWSQWDLHIADGLMFACTMLWFVSLACGGDCQLTQSILLSPCKNIWCFWCLAWKRWFVEPFHHSPLPS